MSPPEQVDDEPWRSMTAKDALAYLAVKDAAQRTLEAQNQVHALSLDGLVNRRRLVAWRREKGLCPKCGRAIRVDMSKYKHCERCRETFRLYQRYLNANLTEPQRLARNERARKSYYKIAHGKPPPSKVVRRPRHVVTPVVTPMVTGVVTPIVAREPDGPKRDRAEYMRDYRAAKAAQQAEPK